MSNLADLKINNPWSEAGKVTISVGVACVKPLPGKGWESLIESADKALYQAEIKLSKPHKHIFWPQKPLVSFIRSKTHLFRWVEAKSKKRRLEN